MTNHKRKRPKKQRAGCAMCKPHKQNGSKVATRDPVPVQRAIALSTGHDDGAEPEDLELLPKAKR